VLLYGVVVGGVKTLEPGGPHVSMVTSMKALHHWRSFGCIEVSGVLAHAVLSA
jgi:hypothetical protein